MVVAIKLEHGKRFIRYMTILTQYYVEFAFTDDCLAGIERCSILI